MQRFVSVVALVGCGGAPAQKSTTAAPPIANTTPQPATEPGERMPDLALIDIRGGVHNRASLAGQVVVVNFFATWAKPSQKELPILAEAALHYTGKATVLGVLTDQVDDATLGEYITDNGITFPVIRGTSEILAAYDYPQALPASFVFDKTGALAKQQVGAFRDADLTTLLESLVTK